MKTRKATKEDVEEIVKISKNIFPDTDWVNPKKLSRCLEEGKYSFVVEENGKIIAAVIAETDEEEQELVYIQYMGATKRGQGIGTELLKRVEEEVKEHKKKGIMTDTENPRFYLKYGYKVCGFLYYGEDVTFVVKEFNYK